MIKADITFTGREAKVIAYAFAGLIVLGGLGVIGYLIYRDNKKDQLANQCRIVDQDEQQLQQAA